MKATIRVLCTFVAVSYGTSLLASDLSNLIAAGRDPTSAKPILEQLVRSGDATTIGAIGVMLFDGIGVAMDHPAAMPFLQKAAELNRPEAQYRLGLAYSVGSSFYSDPSPDPKLADEWFRKAADSARASVADDPAAMTVLASLELTGSGSVTKDAESARTLFLKAAELGYPQAEIAYADWLSRDRRRPVDQAKLHGALNWYGKAAFVGASEALQGMGLVYLALDEPERARPLLRSAALLGREPASRFLYLRFREEVGDNVAIQQDRIFAEAARKRKLRDIADRLSDPSVIAMTIVALSAIVGLSVYNPDRKSDPKFVREYNETLERNRRVFEKQYETNMCIDPGTGRTWWQVGPCY
jgi:TPR repeat protein